MGAAGAAAGGGGCKVHPRALPPGFGRTGWGWGGSGCRVHPRALPPGFGVSVASHSYAFAGIEAGDEVFEGVAGVVGAVFDWIEGLGFVLGEVVAGEALDESGAARVNEECGWVARGGGESAADEAEAGVDGGGWAADRPAMCAEECGVGIAGLLAAVEAGGIDGDGCESFGTRALGEPVFEHGDLVGDGLVGGRVLAIDDDGAGIVDAGEQDDRLAADAKIHGGVPAGDRAQ